MYETLKKHKKLSCLLFAVIISFFCYTVTVSAADCVYGSWNNDLVQRISVANFVKDIGRNILYTILRAIAGLIDMVEDAIDEVLHLNIYEGVKQFFNFDSWIYPLASAVFLICLIGCTTFLMIFYNKGRMSVFIKSVIMAVFLIGAFPALISALTDLKDAGVSSVEAIDPSGATSYVKHSIGDSILSSITVDMEESGKYGVERYISQTEDYKTKQDIPYNVNINATIDSDGNTPYKYKVSGADPVAKNIKKYDDLTDDNILEMLGVKSDCDQLNDLYDNFISSSKSNGTHDINNFYINYGRWIDNEGGHKEWNYSSTRGDYIWYSICYNVYLELFYNSQIDHTLLEGVVWKTNSSFTLTDEYTMKVEPMMNDASDTIRDYKISPSPKSLITKLVSQLRSTGIARQLNTYQNEIESEKDTEYDYTFTKLYTDADLEEDEDWNIDAVVRISKFLENGFTVSENVYKYDYDFVFGAIVLVSVLICLLSAGIRLVRLLLDIVFMQIIGPIVFASDLQESGRTKRLLSEVISSFIVIIIVLLLIKLYIIILIWTFNQNISWITKLFIVFGGWRFTIDGPDIVTKICGIDAGVKSGQAALLGAYAAGRTAVGIGRGVSHAAASGAGGISHAVKGAYQGVKSGNGKGFNNTVKDAKGVGKATALATYGAGSVLRGGYKAAGASKANKVSINGAKSNKDFSKDKNKQQPNYNSGSSVKGRQNYYKNATVSKPDGGGSGSDKPVISNPDNGNDSTDLNNEQENSRYGHGSVVTASDSGSGNTESVSDKTDNNNGNVQNRTQYNNSSIVSKPKNVSSNNTNATETRDSGKDKSSSEHQNRKVNNSSHKPVVNHRPQNNDIDSQKQRIANEYEAGFNQGVERRKIENQVNSKESTNKLKNNKPKGADK